MSSNRLAIPSDAIVMRQDEPVGAVLLPSVEIESFVEEFNRTYESIGMRLSVNGTVFQRKVSA